MTKHDYKDDLKKSKIVIAIFDQTERPKSQLVSCRKMA